MGTERLGAFSDGVIAIIITIMVLELKIPKGTGYADLLPLVPSLISYMLSFVYVGIYWNNHHHLLHAARRVDGLILWANSNLLFWLSLIPAATAWQGQHFLAPTPTLVYAVLLFLAAVSYYLLQQAIVRRRMDHRRLAEALATDFKGVLSIALYFSAIVAAEFVPVISVGIFVLVALIWFVPDRRVERVINGLDRDPL